MSTDAYVHGYSASEAARLADQASTLTELLHSDTRYAPDSEVLEAGCGIGAQTVPLALGSPQARITSIDISEESLARARESTRRKGIRNVTFQQGDIYRLGFPDKQFDHTFVCFVLEHLARPEDALRELRRLLRPRGTITVIEGDHGSFYCHPETEASKRVVQCLIRRQDELGGDALIGRRLYPLLKAAGFKRVETSPRMVYVDGSRPKACRWIFKKDVHCHGRGCRRAGDRVGHDRSADLEERHRRSLPRHRSRRRLLLYLLQVRRRSLIEESDYSQHGVDPVVAVYAAVRLLKHRCHGPRPPITMKAPRSHEACGR